MARKIQVAFAARGVFMDADHAPEEEKVVKKVVKTGKKEMAAVEEEKKVVKKVVKTGKKEIVAVEKEEKVVKKGKEPDEVFTKRVLGKLAHGSYPERKVVLERHRVSRVQ
jgi:metal-dependent hydrolase (beta-lactamase superfamily II)